MLLTQLQRHLSRLYETPTEYDIYDFLITDPAIARAITPQGHCSNEERLLISQSDHHLDISVYLDHKTLTQLNYDDPIKALHEGNLSAFMLALESVSHFQYLCWNANFDKSVTLLELELQAEVDKYVMALTLLRTQGTTTDTNTVHRRLFKNVHFRRDLEDQDRSRYQAANNYAAKYCRNLSDNFPTHQNQADFLSELRRFYRLTQNEKIRRIESMA